MRKQRLSPDWRDYMDSIKQRLKILERGQSELTRAFAELAGRVSKLEVLQAGDDLQEKEVQEKLTLLRTDLDKLAEEVGNDENDTSVPTPPDLFDAEVTGEEEPTKKEE